MTIDVVNEVFKEDNEFEVQLFLQCNKFSSSVATRKIMPQMYVISINKTSLFKRKNVIKQLRNYSTACVGIGNLTLLSMPDGQSC